MNFYSPQSPVILTDAIYELYGGHLDNTSWGQRQAAYTIAEVAAVNDIGTFLLPTIYTGTFQYTPNLLLDHSYVHRIIIARFKAYDEEIYHTVSGTANWDMALRDADYGMVDIGSYCNYYCSHLRTPYQLEMVYQAGLTSGTSYSPNVLLPLTTYADIVLNEMIGYGNEAPGDIGVKEFSNQQYSEKRFGMTDTAFGSSARAQFAHRLLGKLRKNRYVGLGQVYR